MLSYNFIIYYIIYLVENCSAELVQNPTNNISSAVQLSQQMPLLTGHVSPEKSNATNVSGKYQ